ncbi:MAG: hypothetical protein ACE5GA_09425, partial [Candidatus Zixiibacteriota bacterium]
RRRRRKYRVKSKISGTAVNLSSTQNVTGTKIFSGVLRVGDSTMYANNNGIVFGTNHAPFSNTFMNISRDYNTTAGRFGFRVFHKNSSTGNIYGIESEVFSDGVTRRAVLGRASGNFSGPPTGESYGVYGWGERGATAYGVYGRAAFALTNYAGYFFGNAHVTNTLTKGAGAFKIDHPLDPANRYLQHSFVESPDMKNVYDGNVTIDANGEAAVTLPDYFEALNRDFRYQLTAVGAPGPNLHVARKISGNSFRIAGGEPGMEVCWQVTGTRQDAYANAHRIQVEVGKPAGEKGLYMHPVEHSQSETLQLHYEQHKRAESNLRKSGGRK